MILPCLHYVGTQLVGLLKKSLLLHSGTHCRALSRPSRSVLLPECGMFCDVGLAITGYVYRPRPWLAYSTSCARFLMWGRAAPRFMLCLRLLLPGSV